MQVEIFEVFNEKGTPMMNTIYEEYVPSISTLTHMSKCGYKFKLNKKSISKTKLIDLLKQGKM